MKLSDMKTSWEMIERGIAHDPEVRAEWERTALARAVALYAIKYRTEHELTQTAFAQQLGMAQPQVSRLERGEVSPSLETLARLVAVVGEEISIDIRHPDKDVTLLTKAAQKKALGDHELHGAHVMIAAA